MVTAIQMPRLSKGMTEGTVAAWLVREGDPVTEGEPIVEVLTDKAAVEMTAPIAGTLLRIIAEEGDVVSVGAVMGYIGQPGDDIPQEEQALSSPVASAVVDHPPPSPTTEAPTRARVAPKARRLASEYGIDLNQITGSGPEGLILERDLLVLVEQLSKEPPRHEDRIPLIGRRKLMAERMALSKRTAAHATTVAEVDMTEVKRIRGAHGATFTAYVCRAVATALPEFPLLNSMLDTNHIVLKKRVNLGAAVDTEEGLLVVVVHDANEKGLSELDRELKLLAQKGRDGDLTAEDVSDPTFTITNSGVLGSLFFTPIINPPQAATLGVGKIMDTPVVRNDQVVVRAMMYLCLSYDHRIVEGATAVRFLQKVKALLEDPKQLTEDQ